MGHGIYCQYGPWLCEMTRQDALWPVGREYVVAQNLLFFLVLARAGDQASDFRVRIVACLHLMLGDFHLYIVANVFEHDWG